MPRASLIYSNELMAYDFSPEHPLRPVRLKMTYELISSYGLLDSPNSRLLNPRPATEEEVLLAHDRNYLKAVKRLSADPNAYVDHSYGFHASDNPPFAGMYEASLLYTGASALAAELVMAEEVDVSFSISGGLHHAHRARAAGFCVFNDAVVAVKSLLEKFRRIAYIDIDAHHGDGVQEAFYDTDEVMTVSIHQSGRWLFPGTGMVEEIGKGKGLGYGINAPLAPGSGDAIALRVFDSAIAPLLDIYKPEVVVAQLGVDCHFGDPLTNLAYTSDGWLQLVRRILSLGVPVVALGGGGYDVRTVCRLWTLAYSAMLGVELQDDIPTIFADAYQIRHLRDRAKPQVSASEERRASEYADKTISEIHKQLFPLHGISLPLKDNNS